MANKNNILYSKPFPSTRNGALFNAFSYPTKISPESEALFIACHTNIGDTVLDPFGGSGTTGIATLLCDKPTDNMKKLAKAYGLNPKWGPRKAYVYEISTSGCMLGDVMCHTQHKQFEKEVNKLLKKCEVLANQLYSVKDDMGEKGLIRYIIWTDILECPHCGHEVKYTDVAVKENPVKFLEKGICPHCGRKIIIAEADKVKENVLDSVLQKGISVKKRVPFKIYGITGKRKWSRYATEADIKEYLELINNLDYSKIPLKQISWGELYRQGYHYGISHIHHFYTNRNAVMFSYLWSQVEECNADLRNALRIFLLSYNSSHSTLMTRVVAKKNSKDFVLTGAQPGVLYISSLPVEKNIFMGLTRKQKVFVEALSLLDQSSSVVHFINKSCTTMDEIDLSSIDYIFTDPPFGDFIPYSEINQINECWLGQVTNNKDEVIINNSQGKDLSAYANLMNTVFANMAEKLKSDGLCTLVFHSAKAEIWRSIIKSYKNAGLGVCCVSILDKVQKTFKQTNSNVTVKGDPIILLEEDNKPLPKSLYKDDVELAQHLLDIAGNGSLDKEESTRLFSKYIISCIEYGLKITLDAKYFFKDGTGK